MRRWIVRCWTRKSSFIRTNTETFQRLVGSCSDIKLYFFTYKTVLFSRHFSWLDRIVRFFFVLCHHFIETFCIITKATVFMKVALLTISSSNLHTLFQCNDEAYHLLQIFFCFLSISFVSIFAPFFSFLIFIQLTNMRRNIFSAGSIKYLFICFFSLACEFRTNINCTKRRTF